MVLAIDVSLSMRAADVEPNRITAARMVSLATLFPEGGYDLESLVYGARGGRDRRAPLDRDPPSGRSRTADPVAPGSYESATIILLSLERRKTELGALFAMLAPERR